MKYFFSKSSSKMLVASILTGVLYSFLGEILIGLLCDVVPSVVLTFIYFTFFFLVLGIVLYFVSKLILNKCRFSVLKKAWAISFVLIMVCSLLFEFIYDIIQKKEEVSEINSYLFVIDDSGSMETNDPQNIRYEALDALVEGKPADFEYGVISFADDVLLLREMAPIRQNEPKLSSEATGGTAMKAALQYMQEKTESGELGVSEDTRIILLTDGSPTDFFFRRSITPILNYFAGKHITISTVGLMHSNESLMQMIADKTGGVFVNCQDVKQLDMAMQQASIITNQYRNLLGYRDGSALNALLGILRVIFVSLLGLIIAAEKTAICNMFLDSRKVLVTSVIGGILAGICIELGMNVLGLNPSLMRLLVCILLAITIVDEDSFIGMNDRDDYKSTQDTWE